VADILTNVLAAGIHRSLPETHVYNRGEIKTHIHTQNTKLQLQLRHNQTSTYKQTNNLERCSIYPSDVIPLTPPLFQTPPPCDKSTLQHNPKGTNGTYTPPIPVCDTTCYTGTISPPPPHPPSSYQPYNPVNKPVWHVLLI